MKFGIGVAVMILALTAADLASAQVQPPQDRINTGLARARQVGIPVALLESKIAEGKAKGVSLERIAAAVERREAALEKAQQALRGQPDATSSLSVGADAVESGVSEAVLKAVADSAPRDRRNVAIAALTELVLQGHVPEAALERVREALKRGPDALANLPAEAAAARRGGAGAAGQRGGAGGGGAGTEPGPPAGVPAPGNPPQAGRPGGAPTSTGRPTTPGRDGR
jgi:tetratricopeptide (TPR) repeat protein